MHFCADPVNKHEETKKHFIISSEAADAKQQLLSFTGLWKVEAVVHAGLPKASVQFVDQVEVRHKQSKILKKWNIVLVS